MRERTKRGKESKMKYLIFVWIIGAMFTFGCAKISVAADIAREPEKHGFEIFLLFIKNTFYIIFFWPYFLGREFRNE